MTSKPPPSISVGISEVGAKVITSLWKIGTSTFSLIKISENHTYLIKTQTFKKYIIRLTPSTHRTKKAIQSELDFIFLLSNSSLHLCKPILNTDDNYIGVDTPYSDQELFYAVLFEYAQGVDVTEKWIGLMDDKIITALGKTIAEMHNIATKKGGDPERWSQMEKGIPLATQTHEGASDINRIKLRAETGDLTSQILAKIYDQKIGPFFKSLGKPTDATFGVIHGDLTLSNYFAKDDILYLFDFDQLHVNWYGADIGVVLTWARFYDEMGWVKEFDGDHYRSVFLEAYKSVATGMIDAGHLEPNMLQGWELYREWYNCSICVECLFQAENGKHFDNDITSFCEGFVSDFEPGLVNFRRRGFIQIYELLKLL